MTALSDQALAGRVIVVTGAARGIGAGIVEATLAAGASVALIDRNEAAANETALRLDPSAKRLLALSADVTKPESLLTPSVRPLALGPSTGGSTMRASYR